MSLILWRVTGIYICNRISMRHNVLFNCKIDKIAVSLSAMMRKMCIILLISTTTETLENTISCCDMQPKRIEYILEGNLLEKSVKRPFCCIVSILQVYFTYLCYITLWALEYLFIENLKLLLKENQIMK